MWTPEQFRAPLLSGHLSPRPPPADHLSLALANLPPASFQLPSRLDAGRRCASATPIWSPHAGPSR